MLIGIIPEKSLAKKWAKTDNFDYFELDSSFDENYKNEKLIRNKIGEKVVESLSNRDVLVDDTNHLKSMRHFWFSIAARARDNLILGSSQNIVQPL